MAADERAQLAVVVLFVLNDVLEDGDRALVAEGLELLAVAGDVAALFDFEAAQGHAHAAGAVGQRVGLAAGAAAVDGLGPAQLLDAAFPQRGVLHLGWARWRSTWARTGSVSRSARVVIGVVALHLGLPVALQGRQNLLSFGAAQGFFRHTFLLASNPYLLLRL